MKEIDDTPVSENESECPCCAELALRVAELRALYGERITELASTVADQQDALKKAQVELADLHFGRRVSRQQADDQDPEWH